MILLILGVLLVVTVLGGVATLRNRVPRLAAAEDPKASASPADRVEGLADRTSEPIDSTTATRLAPGPEVESPLFSGLPADVAYALDDIGRLDLSIELLRRVSPDLSAAPTLTGRQRRWMVLGTVAAVVGFIFLGHLLLILLLAPIIAAYLAALGFRLVLFRRSLVAPDTMVITDDEAMAPPDWRLPVYTVLVPAFHEPEVIRRSIDQLRALRYPRDRLDIKLLLEADDAATIAAAREAVALDPEGIDIVLVPPGEPRTKPKALNYGLTLARGQLLTIYDAEDRPEPLQLRRAAVALGRLPDDIVCLQAKLAFFNPQQNLITRWFAIEYTMWFSQLLPGLVATGAPVPLGGTSNHFRRHVLADIAGWDPFNVTEDADLGVRLHRFGFRTGVLESITYEEANSDFVNWVRQRSRWYKGYLQTWLVTMRHPSDFRRSIGWRGFILYNLFVGGTPLLAILNPVFWVMTILWFVTRSTFILSLFPMPVYYAGLICWLAGNFLFVYATMLSAYELDEPKMVLAAALTPLYWIMMSIAATKALLQIIVSPSYWEKTFHGLDDLTKSQSTLPVLAQTGLVDVRAGPVEPHIPRTAAATSRTVEPSRRRVAGLRQRRIAVRSGSTKFRGKPRPVAAGRSREGGVAVGRDAAIDLRARIGGSPVWDEPNAGLDHLPAERSTELGGP